VSGPPATGSRIDTFQNRRYTIEEISKESGLSARTIRFYQTEGTLHPPEHEGRIAYYDDTHLDRLRLIADLKSRGLTLSAIQDLIKESEGQGLSVEEWLRGGRRRRSRPAPSGLNYRRWVQRESAPPASAPTPTPAPSVSQSSVALETPRPMAAPPPPPPFSGSGPASRPRRSFWRRAAWIATVAMLALACAVIILLAIGLEDASSDRRRLRQEVLALEERVARETQADGGPTVAAPPVAPPPPPAPPAAPAAGNAASSPASSTGSSPGGTTRVIVVPTPPPPAPPPPAPPPTTTTTSQPCTVLPILGRCL
jgi:DNA-binding transcriptional MerR regulator